MAALVLLAVLVLGWAGYQRYQRFEQRLARARATAIAAGVPPEEVAKMNGRAVLSRLMEGRAQSRARQQERLQVVERQQRAQFDEDMALSAAAARAARPTPDAVLARATGMLAGGDPAGALKVAVGDEPARARLRFEADLALGDLASAAVEVARAGNDAEARLCRGRYEDATGRDDAALASLRAAAAGLAGADRPTRARAAVALGTALLRQGDHIGARARAEEAIALDWSSQPAFRLAAEVARRDGRWQDVATLLDRHLRSFPDAGMSLALAEAYRALDQKSAAGTYLDLAASEVADGGPAPHARLRLALDRPYDRGLPDAAALVASAHGTFHDLEFLLLAAEVAARRGDWAGVRDAADTAAATGVHDARVWYWQGRAAAGGGDGATARAAFARALARDERFDPVARAWLRANGGL